MAEADVEHHFRCEEVVGQRHVVRLHYGERRIAVGERCRVGAVGVGIELADAWSRDAHGVGQSEVGCRRDVADASRRNEIAIVFVEVAVAVLGIFHALEGMLVAQAEACVVLLLGELILCIACHDALQVAVEHAAGVVEHVVAVDDVVETAVALVASADELRARLQRLSLAEVECQVSLPGMAGAPRT